MSDFNSTNADEIASIYIEAILNTANIDKSLGELNKKKYQLNVDVDDSALYALNKHLDLKFRHLKEVNSYFASNPITPTINTQKLDELSDRLTKLTSQSVTVKVNQQVTQEVTTKLSQTLVTDFSKIASKAVGDSIKDSLKQFKQNNAPANDAGKELKEGAKEIRSVLDSFIKDSLSFLAKPAKDLVTGFSEGVSNDLGKQVSKGLQQTFAKQLGFDFKKMGKQAGNSLLGAFGVKVKKENKILTSIGNTADVAIGSISKSVESYAIRKLNKTVAKSIDGILQSVFSSTEIENEINQSSSRKKSRATTGKPKTKSVNTTSNDSDNTEIEKIIRSTVEKQQKELVQNTKPDPQLLNIPIKPIVNKQSHNIEVDNNIQSVPLNFKAKSKQIVNPNAGLTPLEVAAKDSNKNFGYVLNEIGNFKVKNSPVGGGNQTVKRVGKEITKIKIAHQQALSTFKNLLDSANELGDYKLVDQIYRDFVKNSETAKTQIDALLQEGRKAGLKKYGYDKLASSKSNISRSIGNSSGSIPSKYQTIGRKAESESVALGLNVVSGLGKGLDNKAFAKYGIDNATAYLNAIKIAFEIKSPSRVMMRIGAFLGQGLFQGIQGQLPKINQLISDIKFQFDKNLASLHLNLPTGIRNQVDHLGFNYQVRKPEIDNAVSGVKNSLGDVLKSVIDSLKDTKAQGGSSLGVFISNALKAGGGAALGSVGIGGFKASSIPSMLGSVISGNVGGDFITKAIPLLIPFLGLKGLNLGDSIVKILNNNLAIKPGFLTDLLKSVTGLKLESTGFIQSAFSMFGVKGKGKGLTPSSDVINKKIQGNIGDIGLGGSVEDLFSNLGNSFVNAILGKMGMSGLKADLIKNIINQKIKSASGLITTALSGVAGGNISAILSSYAKGDVGGLTTKTGDFLSSIGINLDPKKVTIAVGLILTTLTSLHKAFTEEGFNLGKALAKGFSDSQKNWQNAGDDLKRSAKKSVGADSLGDITKDIAKRMSRGTVVSKDMFDEFFNQVGKGFKNRALKGIPGEEKQGMFGNILSFGASISTMFAPIATFATALMPLLIPMMPILGALGGLAMMVGKHLGSLANAIKNVEPLQQRLNFLAGSKESGKKELNYARDTANKYNAPIQESINAYSQLAVAARGTKLEGDGVKELYEGISASLTTLGLSGQDASLVFLAYTQILSKGKLSMEELRQQLGEKFPPAMGVFAKAMGVSVGELNNLVAKGAVLSEDILPKVAKVLKDDYGKSASSVNNFTTALTKLGNVGFDIAITLTNAFGGVFAMFTNVATGALSLFRDSLQQLLPIVGSVMIGVTAVTGVGLATILNAAPIAEFLATANNLLVSGLGALMGNLAPYYLGIITDVADGWLGAQNDLMVNMSKGVTNIFVSLFTTIDNMSRSAFDKPLFSDYVGKVDGLAPMLQGITGAFGGLFRIIPSGVVELGALVLMFEQTQVLAKMFLIPSLKGVGASLKDIGSNLGGMLKNAFSGNGLRDLFANTFSMHNISKSVTSSIQAIKGALMGLMPIAAEAAIALGVILFARSDFSNPISDAIGKMASEINGAMKSITSSVEDLAKKFGEAGKSAKGMADSLPSKGMELNLGYALGMGGESLKSDDVINAKNSGNTSKIPWYISMLFSDNADAKRFNNKEVTKTKNEADSFGIGKYFTGEEGEITLAQTQLLNQFKDIQKNSKGLSSFTNSNNLTKETSSNLISGDIKKAVDEVSVLDRRLFKLGKERTNLSLINTSEARTKISEIDKQIMGIEKERTAVAKPLIAMFDDVNSWGASIDELIKGIDSSTNPPDVKRRLKESLEPMKQAAKEASDIITKNLPVKPLEDVYTKTISALTDVELAYEKFGINSKIDTSRQQEKLYSSEASKGSLDSSLAGLSLQDLQKQQSTLQNVRVIRQRSLENLTSLPDSNKSEDRKKEITDLRKNLKEDDEKLADLGSTIAKAKRDIRQTLIDQTKQVADYYRNAVKEALTINTEFQKAQNTLKNLNVQNRLKKALIGAGDNIYTQFVDGLISSLQELSEIENNQITADQKKAEYLNQIDEIKIQGAELQRNLPGEIVPFDSNVIVGFNNQLITVDGTVNTINSSVNKVEESLGNDLVEAIKKANTQLDVTNEKVLNITENSVKTSQKLKDTIEPLPQAITKIDEGFGSIGETITNLINQTGDWIKKLFDIPGLITNITNSTVNGLTGNKNQPPNKAPQWMNSLPGFSSGYSIGENLIKGSSNNKDVIDNNKKQANNFIDNVVSFSNKGLGTIGNFLMPSANASEPSVKLDNYNVNQYQSKNYKPGKTTGESFDFLFSDTNVTKKLTKLADRDKGWTDGINDFWISITGDMESFRKTFKGKVVKLNKDDYNINPDLDQVTKVEIPQGKNQYVLPAISQNLVETEKVLQNQGLKIDAILGTGFINSDGSRNNQIYGFQRDIKNPNKITNFGDDILPGRNGAIVTDTLGNTQLLDLNKSTPDRVKKAIDALKSNQNILSAAVIGITQDANKPVAWDKANTKINYLAFDKNNSLLGTVSTQQGQAAERFAEARKAFGDRAVKLISLDSDFYTKMWFSDKGKANISNDRALLYKNAIILASKSNSLKVAKFPQQEKTSEDRKEVAESINSKQIINQIRQKYSESLNSDTSVEKLRTKLGDGKYGLSVETISKLVNTNSFSGDSIASTRALSEVSHIYKDYIKQFNINLKEVVKDIKPENPGIDFKKPITDSINSLESAYKSTVGNLNSIYTSTVDQVNSTYKSTIDTVNKGIKFSLDIPAKAKETLTNINPGIDFKKPITDSINSLETAYKSTVGNLNSIYTSTVDQVNSTYKSTVETVRDGIKFSLDIPAKAKETLTTINPGIDFKKPITDSINSLESVYKSTVGNLNSIYTSTVDQVNSTYKSTVETVRDGIKFSLEIPELFNFNKELANTNDLGQQVKNNSYANTDAIKKANTELDVTNQKVLNITNQSKNFTNTLKAGFSDISSGISDVVSKTSDWLASLSSSGGLLSNLASSIQGLFSGDNSKQPDFVKQLPGFQGGIDAVKNFFGSKGVLKNPLSFATNPDDEHHAGRAYHEKAGQMYRNDNGIERLVKDIVLTENGKQSGASIPSPVAGTLHLKSDPKGYGNYAEITNDKGEVISRLGHMKGYSPNVKDGQQVIPGQVIGYQGSTGHSTGTHLHVELPANLWGQFVTAMKSGNYSELQAIQGVKSSGNSNMVDPRPANNAVSLNRPSSIKQGGNDLTKEEYARLTPQGKQLYELRNNKNILALADGVARAEGTDFRENSKNFGYGMLIGGENTNNLSVHPFVEGGLPYRHNSSASGRYQMMDFNYSKSRVQKQFGRGAKTDLESIINYGGKDTPGTFSPGLQDLYFIQSLKSRGVLEKVINGQIDSSVLNELAPHYASIQSGSSKSAYGGQGTPEGQHKNLLSFIEQRKNLSGLNSTVMQGGFIQPNQMQGLVSQATRINLNNAQKRYQTDEINSGLDPKQQEGKRLEFERNFDSRIRTLQRGLFDASTNRMNSTRSVTDLGTSNLMPVKSPEQQFNLDQENRTRQYDDKIRELQQKLNELKVNLVDSEKEVQKAIADSTLKTIDPARYQQAVDGTKTIYASIQEDIKSYSADLIALDKQKTEALKASSEHFNKTEYFRLVELSLQSETQKISILQQQVEQYKQLQQVDPLNALVLKIPALERNLAVMNAEKELRQEIINADKEYYNQQITQEQYEEKIRTATKQNQLKKESIGLTLEEATTTSQLTRKTQELEKTQFLQQSKMKGLQLDNDRMSQASKNGIVDLKTLTNELTIKINDLTSVYERQRLELEKRNDLTPQEKLKENLRNANNFRKETQLATNENAYKVRETELVTNPQALMDNKIKRQDLLGKPGDDLKQLQIDDYRNKGGNEFVANKMSRELATKQENARYEKELGQLNIDVAKFNLENPNIAITTEELTKLTDSVKALHGANIQKIGMDFKSFGMSLNTTVSDSVKGLGASFTELIKGTKSLNDVLDGFFDQILSGVLQTGINSLLGGLMGGLFYQGGVVPNYASGGIANAFTKEASESGRKPLLAVVHEGEMLIPADRLEQLMKAGITPESLLGINNYANGGVVGSMKGSSVAQSVDQARGGTNGMEVKYQSTVINNQSYVTSEQFEEGVRKAAQAGAEGGFNKVQSKLSNSSSFRRSVGI